MLTIDIIKLRILIVFYSIYNMYKPRPVYYLVPSRILATIPDKDVAFIVKLGDEYIEFETLKIGSEDE